MLLDFDPRVKLHVGDDSWNFRRFPFYEGISVGIGNPFSDSDHSVLRIEMKF